MKVVLNGVPRELPAATSVADAIAAAGANGERRGVAVALDGEVVPRSAWETTRIREGQRVEILTAVQGG